MPHGVPDAMTVVGIPFKILQMPGVTILLFEEFHKYRQIHTDGRQLPVDFGQPAWYGYSIGRWKATPSSSKPGALKKADGSITAAIRIPRRCAQPNASAASTSATWRSTSRSTTRKRTHGRGSRTRCASPFSLTLNCSSISAKITGTCRFWSGTGADKSRPVHQRRENSKENTTRNFGVQGLGCREHRLLLAADEPARLTRLVRRYCSFGGVAPLPTMCTKSFSFSRQ